MPDTKPILRLAHSPDPDDAFMWWPLFEVDGAAPRLDTGRFAYEPVTEDIETLNRRSVTGELEITAMSCAQYPRVRDRYAVTACGASLGDAVGPRLVALRPMTHEQLRSPDAVIAVPGERTSAFGALNLLLGPGTFRHREVPFDEIPQAVLDGDVTAGVVIHEGQLTHGEQGLQLIEDLGRWWTATRGLPLPLGINAIRRDLETSHGPGTLEAVTTTLLASVRYALAHREASIEYALRFARGIDPAVADRFIGMYVNRWTLDFGDSGVAAVERFLGELHAAGLVPDPGPVAPIAAGG